MKLRRTLLLLLIASPFTAAARAAPIETLFNTGVDVAGAVLPDSTLGDPHYTLISTPGGTSEIRIITSAGGFPISSGLYMGDNGLSRWIGPNNDPDLSGPPGIYVYRTTFSLAGYDTSSALITGQVSSDNWLRDVRLNGVSLGISTDFESFRYFTPFSISSGFFGGENLLDFCVENGSGPTALRVEMAGSANRIAAVPDRSSVTPLLLVGVVMPILLHAHRAGCTNTIRDR